MYGDPPRRRPYRLRRLDERLGGDRERRPPGETHQARHHHQRKGEDHVVDSRSEDARHAQGQNQRRDCGARLHQPHDDEIDPAALEAGEDADRDGDSERECNHGDDDAQRHLTPEHQPAEDVTPRPVGPEQVVRARRLVGAARHPVVGSVRCEPRGEGAPDGDHEHERGSNDRRRFAQEAS